MFFFGIIGKPEKIRIFLGILGPLESLLFTKFLCVDCDLDL